MLFAPGADELRVEPDEVTRSLFGKIDVSQVEKTNGGTWRRGFEEAQGATNLTPNQVCRFLYGPYFNPRRVQSYNAHVELRVDPADLRSVLPELSSTTEWPRLADVADKLAATSEPPPAATLDAPGAELPDYADVVARYRSGSLASAIRHNLEYWQRTNGGLEMTMQHPHTFEPRSEYWWLPERRVLVAYFANYWGRAFAPAQALRDVAFAVFRHFDGARAAGQLAGPMEASEQPDRWAEIRESLRAATSTLPHIPAYEQLRQVWPDAKQTSIREHLLAFFDQDCVDAAEPGVLEKGLGIATRIPWFAYLGLRSLEDLLERQRFFFGFYLLFASTNAYRNGGFAQKFGAVLQNNRCEDMVAYAKRWASGESPSVTRFSVEDKQVERDFAESSHITELFGLLNLQREPFYNGAVAYDQWRRSGETTAQLTRRIGEGTRAFLQSDSALMRELANDFRTLVNGPIEPTSFEMEGIGKPKVAERHPTEVAAQADVILRKELADHARRLVEAWTELEAATALTHLALDAAISRWQLKPAEAGDGQDKSDTRAQARVEGPQPVTGPPPGVPRIELPPSLRRIAQTALALLRAGFHVLLAGPPGTGKTTVAQFAGYAWNMDSSIVPTEILLTEAPRTTVGNSAWAPFHTVGGILPDANGRFVAHRGIFIDKEDASPGVWRLLQGALVLDEMNRADLDRCIGELYPLLSRTVAQVNPAGIPGVTAIKIDERFRLLATVNDSTLDDVVFPISEGLARRFLRLDLQGAALDETKDFVAPDGSGTEARRTIGRELMDTLFKAFSARPGQSNGVLPVGVGYFAPLRAWVAGCLDAGKIGDEADEKDQAYFVLRTCLASARRHSQLQTVLDEIGGDNS